MKVEYTAEETTGDLKDKGVKFFLLNYIHDGNRKRAVWQRALYPNSQPATREDILKDTWYFCEQTGGYYRSDSFASIFPQYEGQFEQDLANHLQGRR